MNTAQEQSREKKRAEFSDEAPKKRRFSPGLLIVLVAVVGLGAYLALGGASDKPAATDVVSTSPNPDSAGAPKTPEIRIPIADLASGKAKFFDYTLSDKTPLRFFAVKSRDGAYRTALDACEVCFHAKKGYQQDGEDMICNNCGRRFAIARIGDLQGGCHPISVPRAVEGDALVVKASELESRGRYFQ